MKIVLTGGGSGGHITPILAVASELKRHKPKAELIYIGLKGDNLVDIVSNNPNIDKVYLVRAGKFRRFHNQGAKQIFNLKIQYLNFRDFIYVIIGLLQSLRLMRKIKPDIVFSRGGFVIVPVCLGAKLSKVPYITHDSDSIPSLANRMVAKWALRHFVALPKETYNYNQDITVTTGIPVSEECKLVTPKLKEEYRTKIGVGHNSKVLLIIGGGLGAASLNEAALEIVPHLLNQFKDLHVIHITGIKNLEEVKSAYKVQDTSRLKLIDFTTDIYTYSGASDLIITRAGATTLAEFAIQGKACIIIPNSYLVAGHQLENAKVFEKSGAASVIKDTELEQDPNRLAKKVAQLLNDPKRLTDMEKAITQFGISDAASNIANRLLKIVENNS